MTEPAAGARERLAATIETIERSYEYLLAYAAQGRRDDAGTEARATLEALQQALAEIAGLARAWFAEPQLVPYLDAVERDAAIAQSAVALVLSRPRIASLLVDNLNASVHLRALLTDVFLLDQALEAS